MRNPKENVYCIDPSVSRITEGFVLMLEMNRDLLKSIVVCKPSPGFLTDDMAALSHGREKYFEVISVIKEECI